MVEGTWKDLGFGEKGDLEKEGFGVVRGDFEKRIWTWKKNEDLKKREGLRSGERASGTRKRRNLEKDWRR